MERYRCKCGWEGTEDELNSRCTFWGTREEPPEYEAYCPDCGANWDNMVEAECCESCESEWAMRDSRYCLGCAADAAEQILEVK